MLRAVTLVSQWRQIESSLPADWARAELRLEVADRGKQARAAALLGPLAPGLTAGELTFAVARRVTPTPQTLRRLLARLDDERITGTLAVAATATEAEAVAAAPARLAAEWDEAVAELPDDWSDLLCRLDLASSDDLPRAALAVAPLNPSRERDEAPGFRFRVARRFGYGASPAMARRCLARLDEAGIPGHVRVLRALSDTRPVLTQGPVWYVGGKAV